MVMNNTKVIQARLHFRKHAEGDADNSPTGALIEVFLLEPAAPADYERMFQARQQCDWHCLVGNLKKWKGGRLTRVLSNAVTLTAERVSTNDSNHLTVRLQWDDPLLTAADIIDLAGELPIPPYLNRQTEDSDKDTYQTVYSKIKGSVAAPTAGLHFTPEVLSSIDRRNIERNEITLHVGAGTFRPVKSNDVADHDMHTEFFSVTRHTIERLIAHNGQCIAVGTTTVRTLESLYYIGRKLRKQAMQGAADALNNQTPQGALNNQTPQDIQSLLHVSQWEPYDDDSSDNSGVDNTTPTLSALQAIIDYMDANGLQRLTGSTQIIIVPGYSYKIVRALVTNFHQPQSTLLLLVSAFLNGRSWRNIYDYALANDFRFLSYGDSSLLIP